MNDSNDHPEPFAVAERVVRQDGGGDWRIARGSAEPSLCNWRTRGRTCWCMGTRAVTRPKRSRGRFDREKCKPTSCSATCRSPNSRIDWYREAWDWLGHIDIWVNNAGVDVLTGPRAKETFEEKIEQLWRVDVLATICLSRAVGQRLFDRGGVILNMGWDQAQHGMAGDSGEMFATIKGAVMAFTRSLAQSLAPRVRVNCLAPGWIQTTWGQQASDAWQARACGDSLLRRWGSADDVARAWRYLVGPAAWFVNGQILAVNGGFRYGTPHSP